MCQTYSSNCIESRVGHRAIAVQHVAQVSNAFAAADVVQRSHHHRGFRIEPVACPGDCLSGPAGVDGMLNPGPGIALGCFGE